MDRFLSGNQRNRSGFWCCGRRAGSIFEEHARRIAQRLRAKDALIKYGFVIPAKAENQMTQKLAGSPHSRG